MNNDKKFRDSFGSVGCVGSVIALFDYPYYGVTHVVVDFDSNGVFVRRAYRGRKTFFLPWKERTIRIVG